MDDGAVLARDNSERGDQGGEDGGARFHRFPEDGHLLAQLVRVVLGDKKRLVGAELDLAQVDGPVAAFQHQVYSCFRRSFR